MEKFEYRQSCFVIAPAGIEIAQLLEALRRSRFEPFFISDFLLSGEHSASQIRSAFKSVDFVIVLLFQGRALENVFFELGFALGVGRPIFVFSDYHVKLPEAFRGLQVHYLHPNALVETVVSTVAHLWEPVAVSDVRGADAPRVASPIAKGPRVPREKLRTALDGLRSAYENSVGFPAGQQFQAQLTDVFASAGATVVEGPPRSRRRDHVPDLALWIDDVQKVIGNPIAVEIKSPLYEEDLDDAITRLAASLPSIGAKAGILIHDNPHLRQRHPVIRTAPLIFLFSVPELIEVLENKTFASTLKNLRNSAVHGLF